MDVLINELFSTSGAIETITVVQLVMSLFLSFILSLIVGYIYQVTHQGTSYSQSTVQTMVIMSMVVAVIMIIIGSNIARAFSLVGALSIIRFRNAVKESRDVAFYFLSMAVGMSCGTGFYGVAIVFTLCMSVIIYGMARFNVGAKSMVEMLLKIDIDNSVDYKSAFDEVFYKFTENDHLLTVDRDETDRLELVYTMKLRKNVSEQAFLDAIKNIHQSIRTQLIRNDNTITVLAKDAQC